MTGSAFKAMDVVVGCLSYEKGGGLEEGGLQIRPERRPADDGKRFQSDGRCSGNLSYEKGGGLEEGGLNIRPDGRPADFFASDLDCTGMLQITFL